MVWYPIYFDVVVVVLLLLLLLLLLCFFSHLPVSSLIDVVEKSDGRIDGCGKRVDNGGRRVFELWIEQKEDLRCVDKSRVSSFICGTLFFRKFFNHVCGREQLAT